ncbi:MAG: HEAT repeat domain-containing protein [Phormidesmis sp.]
MSLSPMRAVNVDAVRELVKKPFDGDTDTATADSDDAEEQDTEAHDTEEQGTENQAIESQIEQAIAQLSVGDFHSRWSQSKRYARQFALWGDRSIPALLKHLALEQDPDTQWFLVRLLAQFDHPSVVESLAQLLVTTDSETLQSAISKALAGFGETAVATLSNLLASSTDGLVESAVTNNAATNNAVTNNAVTARRLLAVRTLAHIRRSNTIEPLISVAADRDPTIREIAIEALGSFHDPRITPLLLNALQDEPAICIEAIRTLGRRSDLLNAVDLATPLQVCLRSPHESVACESAIALGRLGHEAAVDALGTQLPQPLATSVKISVVQSLGWLNLPASVAYLVKAFDYPVPVIMPTVKTAIAKALGQTREPALKHIAAQPLIAWLKDHSGNHSNAATSASSDVADSFIAADSLALTQIVLTALARLGDSSAIAPLIPLLTHPDPRIRLHVLSALKQIDSGVARHEIQRYLHSETLSSISQQHVAETLAAW